jgi:hypothetical protein
MWQAIVQGILNEGAWLAGSMALSFAMVGVLAMRQRWRALSSRTRVLSAMNLFYGCMIGTMGSGHLLAVTIKLVQRTLEPSVWVMYLLGLVLAVPGWWLARVAYQSAQESRRFETIALRLNAWLGVSLVGLGLHNFPLAATAALNLGYQFHSRRAVGWTIAGVAIAANLALFAGALIFWASGQTFEQFRGIE